MPEISDDGSARNTSLNRYAFMLRLRPGAEDAYEATHRAVWPEMLSLLKEAGISEYSIYRRDDLLILALRADDFDATWRRIENHPVNLRWQARHGPALRSHRRPSSRREIAHAPGSLLSALIRERGPALGLIPVQSLRSDNLVPHIVVRRHCVAAQHRNPELNQPRPVSLRLMRNAPNQRALS